MPYKVSKPPWPGHMGRAPCSALVPCASRRARCSARERPQRQMPQTPAVWAKCACLAAKLQCCAAIRGVAARTTVCPRASAASCVFAARNIGHGKANGHGDTRHSRQQPMAGGVLCNTAAALVVWAGYVSAAPGVRQTAWLTRCHGHVLPSGTAS